MLLIIYEYFCLISTDPTSNHVSSQNHLLEKFFEYITLIGMREISTLYELQDYCDGWKGIECQNGLAVSVSYSHFQYGNFLLDYLPPTVEKLSINVCKQVSEINVRSLPRNTRNVSLSNNAFFGHLDLTVLPANLRQAEFFNNNIHGPIILTQLPRDLQTLCIEQNGIKQDIVWYGNLPKNINFICLCGHKEACRIHEVRSICSSQRSEKRIFVGVPNRRIH